MSNNVSIVALGGMDENGKNMYCIEVDYRIFIVNCGIKRAEAKQYGIEYVIPDFSYVIENKDRVKAVIITHLHDDMMDALPHLIKSINVPVYAPRICCVFIKEMFKEHGITNYRLYELPRFGKTVVDGITVRSFGLSHAAPEAIGVAIDTPKGSIVVAEQYVVDFDMRDKAFNSDIGAIAEIGNNGVLIAMIESSYSYTNGYTSPRHRLYDKLKPVIEDAEGRVIVTTYSQNYFRINEICQLAYENKRKIFFYDKELRKNMKLLNENGYYKLPKGVEVSVDEFNNDMDNIVVIVSSFGSDVFNSMNKIAIGEDMTIELRETDTVIIGGPVVSGTEKEATNMENELYKENVHVFHVDKKEVLSMHPSKEDVKMMLCLLKPTYFIPTMGSYREFIGGAQLAVDAGFTPDRIVILDNGQVATFEEGKLKSCSTVLENVGETLIDGLDKENITSFVLRDRELISKEGVIIIGVAISFKTKEVLAGPDIQSRGVVYVKDSEEMLKNLGTMAVDTIKSRVAEGTYNNLETRAELREKIARYVFYETGKKPLILPAIIEINI